ncbi:pentapeptide repeat-containing protein [Nocardia otitidiscaviarum]|uniref:Pentapeptide repeat-containing protein n=1 Tax=Nocardia otitidiscaviarum TaxID=1823 RepID=A0A516NP77_9NOCA|nr:pentapeptide repeat-containing protein [Nocardia otitidiscaviarum]MCP9624021.1 pentapeptide repeat-containing protein [Nocardia otitidiscaviarum]QDP80711.1 pentapeptide repeat-containing protein [Nocardia otitidiscaviarum]
MRRRWGWFGSKTERRTRTALSPSVFLAVSSGVAVAALTWWVLWLLFGATDARPDRLDLAEIALWVTAGVGVAVALVLAARRQRDHDRGRFSELFGAAALQLGAADVAVRLAGVYAMAGVADEFPERARRQQCIDVLCAYLRLPYAAKEGVNHLVSRTERLEEDGAGVERVYHYRQNDRQVRDTIVRVIAEHLRDTAESSWSACDFDFTEAVLENADFQNAVFAGDSTRFTNTDFVASRVTSFEGARFIGRRVSFQGAAFRGRGVTFQHARFQPPEADRAEPDGTAVSFAEASFSCPTSFESAEFSGARTTFDRATFANQRTNFGEVNFGSALTSFGRVVFDGDRISFDSAEFSGTKVAFTGARFYAEGTSFDGTQLGARQRWRSGGTQEIDFADAEYHGAVSFADAVFEARSVCFTGGDFFGDISFRRAALHAREVSFERPKAWVGTQFDWDDDPGAKPENVKPEHWPPRPVSSQLEPLI